jgi:hypothetical protein
MNPWSNFATQVRQRLGLLSLRQRAALGGVLGVGLLAGGWYYASQSAAPASVPLWGGQALPTNEVRAAQAKLKEAGVTEVRVVRGQLLVPPDQVTQCENLLQSLAPASEANSSRFEKALGQAAWSVSETHRQELLDSARASDLVAMFKKDPHIADARLMWNRSRKRSFQADTRMTVVLNITPRPGKRIPASLAESLKTAVVSTFGLSSPDDVSLIEFGPDGAQLVRHAETPAPTETSPPRSLAPRVPPTRTDDVELVEHSVSQPSSPRTYAEEAPAGREAARLATLGRTEVSDPATGRPGTRRSPSRTDARSVANPRTKLQTRLEQQLAWIPQVRVAVAARSAENRRGPGDQSNVAVDQPPHVTVVIPGVVTRSLLQPGERPESAVGSNGKPRRSRIDVRRKVEQVVRKELQLGPRVPAREFVTVTFEEGAAGGDDHWSNPITCYLTGLNWRRAGGWVAGGVSGLAALGLLIQRRRRRVASATAAAGGASAGSSAASATPDGSGSGTGESPVAETSTENPAQTRSASPPRRRPTPVPQPDEDESNGTVASGVRQEDRRSESFPTESPRSSRHRSPAVNDAEDESATGFDLDSIRPPRGASAKPAGRRAAGWEPTTEAPVSFAQLHDCSAEEWHQLLEDEQPQTIAVILSQLPPAQSSFVLRMMPSANRLDVVRRMTALETPAPAVLHELAATLATRLRQVRTARATQGIGSQGIGPRGLGSQGLGSQGGFSMGGVGLHTAHEAHDTPPAPQLRHLAMYAQPPRGMDTGGTSHPARGRGAGPIRTSFSDTVSAASPPAAIAPPASGLPGGYGASRPASAEVPLAAARPKPATPLPGVRESAFTDLAMLDDNSLRELFAQFDSEHWAVALRGADEPLVAKLVHALANGDAQHLAATRSALGPVRLGDVDAAQRAIAERLIPLRYRGRPLPLRVAPVTPGFEEPA